MDTKNIVATLYLKNGKSVKSKRDLTETEYDVYQLCRLYNDSGVDKIIIFDLSTNDDEHELNINMIRNINRALEIKTCAGGNINRIEDVKKLMYAGCNQVMFNAAKPTSIGLAEEASQRFGKERILVSVHNVDFVFKKKKAIEDLFHELYILNPNILDAIENLTTVPYVVVMDEFDYKKMLSYLSRDYIRGIAGRFINDPKMDIMQLKTRLSKDGIVMDNFAPALKWSDLKPDADGLVPVIAQDYRTNEVLMMAYMNEEAFRTTLSIGKMTYYSRSRKELITNGIEGGMIQYVKALIADRDCDTLLAKVAQVQADGKVQTIGNFVNQIVKKEYNDKNPQMILERVYDVVKDRKVHPKDGSYTNFLFSQGLDKILMKLGEECTGIVVAAKGNDTKMMRYEISDFLYYMMVLMVEKGITWEEVMNELSQR